MKKKTLLIYTRLITFSLAVSWTTYNTHTFQVSLSLSAWKERLGALLAPKNNYIHATRGGSSAVEAELTRYKNASQIRPFVLSLLMCPTLSARLPPSEISLFTVAAHIHTRAYTISSLHLSLSLSLSLSLRIYPHSGYDVIGHAHARRLQRARAPARPTTGFSVFFACACAREEADARVRDVAYMYAGRAHRTEWKIMRASERLLRERRRSFLRWVCVYVCEYCGGKRRMECVSLDSFMPESMKGNTLSFSFLLLFLTLFFLLLLPLCEKCSRGCGRESNYGRRGRILECWIIFFFFFS